MAEYGASLRLQSFFYGENKNVANDLYNEKTKINGPEFKATFDALDTMVKDGVYPKDILSKTYDQAQQELGTGKAAMIFDGPWLCATMQKAYPSVNLGFFILPDTKGNVTMTTSVNEAVALNASYKNKQQAWI